MRALLVALSTIVVFSGCSTGPSMVGNSGLSAEILAERERARNPGGVANCHNLEAAIPGAGSVEGPRCTDNKAVVNGWSEKCVANNACNTRLRRQELNQAARSFCADWCAAKKCDFVYSSLTACNNTLCLDSRFCQTNCKLPKRDACYFQQSAPSYNCECKDPPPPPPQGVEG